MQKGFFLIILCLVFWSCVSNPKSKIENNFIVIIDPGHGGKDPGADGTYQIENNTFQFLEKDLTLQIAKLLAEHLLLRLPQVQIIFTRNNDVTMSLEDRILTVNRKINVNSNVVFVSLHINYSQNIEASGIEVFYYAPVLLDPDAFITVEYLQNILYKNEPLAEEIAKAIVTVKGLENLYISKKTDDFYLLRNSKVPSVLIECGFLSNSQEAFLLVSEEYQNKIAEGIALGISNYIKKN